MHDAKDSFGQIAAQRRSARTQRISLIERLYASSRTASSDGSPGTAEEREEDLRKLLKTALTSLETLHGMYETREARWRAEEARMCEEREGMNILLQQAFGEDIMKLQLGP